MNSLAGTRWAGNVGGTPFPFFAATEKRCWRKKETFFPSPVRCERKEGPALFFFSWRFLRLQALVPFSPPSSARLPARKKKKGFPPFFFSPPSSFSLRFEEKEKKTRKIFFPPPPPHLFIFSEQARKAFLGREDFPLSFLFPFPRGDVTRQNTGRGGFGPVKILSFFFLLSPFLFCCGGWPPEDIMGFFSSPLLPPPAWRQVWPHRVTGGRIFLFFFLPFFLLWSAFMDRATER